jgi:hypothetical protein
MIHEYALDPAVLSAWASNSRDYAEFMREYGLGTPRIISSFPKKKASKLRSYFLSKGPADSDSLQGQRYLEMVQKMVEVLIIRDGHEPQDSNWEINVKVENERTPFGIVLSLEVIDISRNITPGSMYSPNSIWNHPRQKNIYRTVDGFLTVVTDFLRLATNNVVIVDAFGWTQEAVRTVQYFINSISERRVNSQLPCIYLYYKEKRGGTHSGVGSPDAVTVKSRILQGVSENLSDIHLEVFELREVEGNDVFHNRCILTEHGGIITGHGIAISNDTAHTDEAILMELEIYEKKWRQFVEDNCFEIESHAGK